MKIWNATITALLSAALAAMFVLPPNAAATGHASDTPPSAPANAQEQAARDAFTRILGSAASRFEITVPAQRPAGQDSYSVTTSGDKIRVTASTPSTAVAGLNHYLGSIGQSLSYTVRNVDPTVAFPLPDGELGRTANVAARYYGNDTEDGYTGAHRTFDQWERLIDELAALGFNQVFMPVGSEAVYFDVLRQFGYTAAEAAAWIPSPEHQPWWLLQNMASWPAGTTEASIEARAALGRRIADRLRELGMTPVLPGYFGTVPPGFVARNPGAVVVAQGGWVGFQRPDWLDPNSTVFPAVAAKFYESSATRLGRSTMYKMDLLHEGGQRGTADIPAATKRIEQALQATNPGATWVFLGWQSNPQNDIMGAVNPATTFIVDGITDRYPNGSRETAWLNRPWAYGTIWNYGGDTTIGAKLTRWNTDYFRFKDQAGSAMRGLAAMPEGGGNNGAALDFFANLAWVTGPVDLDQWWADYVFKRYGARDADAVAAWQIVSRTAYTLPTSGDFAEAHDSVYAAIPSLTAATSSQWSPTRPAYDITEFATALPRLLAASDRLGGNPAYRYDLMVLARQVLSNHGRVLLPEIRKAVSAGDLGQFDELTARWMEDMALVDQLAGTQEISLLGRLLDEARSAGTTVEQAAAFERNQRTLLTVWGPRAGYQSGLGDYAGREFQGLVGTYYQPRWQKFFDAHRAALTTGGAVAAFDWFDDAQPWLASADRTGIWSAPRGDVVALARAARAAVERPLPQPAPPAYGDHYLSDLPFLTEDSGTFPVQRDREVSQPGVTPQPLRIAGVTYEKGLGMQAPSTVSFLLGEQCSRFTALVGPDDTMSGPQQFPSIIFRAWGDGALLFESDVLPKGQTAVVDVDVTGVSELELELDPAEGVVNGGQAEAYWWDRGDWAEAKVSCPAPVSPSPSASPSPSPSGSPSPSPSVTPSSSPKPTSQPTSPAPREPFVPTAPYTKAGKHTVNGREWMTTCEPYSRTQRCRTDIWATVVLIEDGRFVRRSGWAFNNLTYLPYMTRAQWGGNPLANHNYETGFSSAGRQWRTECDTARTGKGGCRSYTMTTVYAATAKPGGGYAFTQRNEWVFNNMVLFG